MTIPQPRPSHRPATAARGPVGLINELDLWALFELFVHRDEALRHLLAWTGSWPAQMDDLWGSVIARDDASTSRQIDALLASAAELGAAGLVATAQGVRTALEADDDAALRRRLMVLGEVGRQTMSQLSRVAHTM